MTRVPSIRIRAVDDRPARADGRFVLYWMTSCRRLGWNFALERAVEWAEQLRRPLAIVEVLGCAGRWRNDRHHAFVLQGMADNRRRAAAAPVCYRPYVESRAGESASLFAELAEQAAVVVTDDPAIAAPEHPDAFVHEAPARIEAVDSNGLLPLRAAAGAMATAVAFRRFLQKTLPDHLTDVPRADAFRGARLPPAGSTRGELARCLPDAEERLLAADRAALGRLPIDHSVEPVATPGGELAARRVLERFVAERLARYADERNQPDREATSGLSPYLRHGHLSAFEVFDTVARREGWSPTRLSAKRDGRRAGWWGMSASAEAFLDQSVTWRELGYNFCATRDDFDRYGSLPSWARKTLADHAGDPRPVVYQLDELDAAATHDPIWNAAQTQLRREGIIHNYLRMLWGKKILEWTAGPEEALDVMIELNNRYSIDGCDPNSYSGVFWTLGRYDRPWGPERPIFGKVRYMSSDNTARKLRLDGYLARFGRESDDRPAVHRM